MNTQVDGWWPFDLVAGVSGARYSTEYGFSRSPREILLYEHVPGVNCELLRDIL